METIKTTDIAYLAGYLDGDGCIHIGKEMRKGRLAPIYVLAIKIASVNKEPFIDFQRWFGGSISSPLKQRNKNCKDCYHFSTKRENSLRIAHAVLPYLIERKQECEMLLKFSNTSDEKIKEELIKESRAFKNTGLIAQKKHMEEFNPLKNTIVPTEEDFAYLAGFIDAECCLGIVKWKPKKASNFTYKILLQCCNSRYPVFKWLIERFGGSICFHQVKQSNSPRRNQIHWQITGRALSKIIAKFYPFLKHKQPVCKELMNFYETTLGNGGDRHSEEFRSHYADVIKIREEIVSKVHKLNLKGLN
jgi:hypothetical protein